MHISQRTSQVPLLSTPMQNLMLLTREAASKPVIMNKSLCFELIPVSVVKRKLTTLSKSTIVLSQLSDSQEGTEHIINVSLLISKYAHVVHKRMHQVINRINRDIISLIYYKILKT